MSLKTGIADFEVHGFIETPKSKYLEKETSWNKKKKNHYALQTKYGENSFLAEVTFKFFFK